MKFSVESTLPLWFSGICKFAPSVWNPHFLVIKTWLTSCRNKHPGSKIKIIYPWLIITRHTSHAITADTMDRFLFDNASRRGLNSDGHERTGTGKHEDMALRICSFFFFNTRLLYSSVLASFSTFLRIGYGRGFFMNDDLISTGLGSLFLFMDVMSHCRGFRYVARWFGWPAYARFSLLLFIANWYAWQKFSEYKSDIAWLYVIILKWLSDTGLW